MKTPHEFFLETDGKIIDVDHEYGGQCWDLFALFCQEYCNKTFSCIETGYVIDLWTHFDEVGLGEFFEKVPNNELKDGDWAIWIGPCMITNHSHIAMFRIDNGDGGGTFLTQNPNGNPKYTHQMWISYQGLVGGLRPKCYMQDKTIPNPVERDTSKNQFSINCDDTMRIRLDHSLNGEFIGFGKTGYYNIEPVNMVTQDGYQWYEIDKGKWCALIPPYSEFIGMEQDQKEPNNEENDPYEIELINRDKKNLLVEFVKWILEKILKLIGGTYEKK